MRVRTRDDAGEPTRVQWRWLLPATQPRTLASQFRRVPEVLWPPAIFLTGLLSLVTLALFQGPWVLAVSLFSPMSSSLIFVTIALLLWMGRAAGRHVERCKQAAKREALCPACSYNLRGLAARTDSAITPATEDMLTPCPECGASWDLVHRVGTRTVTIHSPGSHASMTSAK
jgi:hypothetical protein